MSDEKILILGGTTYDHIVYLQKLPKAIPQTIHVAPFNEATGSTGAGKALNLTKLGVPNTLYSVVGNDMYGKQIMKYLKQQKVHFVYDIDEAGTERHINIMDADGGRISMFISQSSEKIAMNMKLMEYLIKNAGIVVLNIIPYCRQLIPLLKKYNKQVWTDLHDYDGKNLYHKPFIDAAQYIHVSSDNLPNYKKLMKQLISAGKELVICTHGKKGASLLTKKGEWIEQPVIPVEKIIDANGAGDSFFAGFLFGFINQYSLTTCMKMGAICASLCIGSKQLASDKLNADYLLSKI
jgi:acarbose 7IV-phosphotransferase